MGVEPTSPAWKAGIFTVIRPLHINPAYKALLLSIRYRPKHRIKRAGNNIQKRQEPWCDWMDLNHRCAFSLLLYQLSYNRIRYSAYKANCTLSSEPRIIDKSYYVTPFGVVLPAGCEPAIHHWHSLLRRTCMLSTTVAYQSCLSSSQPSFRFAKPFHPISSRLDRAGGVSDGT